MAEAAQRPEAPHAFVGGPAWESRPERPPVIDAAALRALAAEVEANGLNPCVNRTLITMELAKDGAREGRLPSRIPNISL